MSSSPSLAASFSPQGYGFEYRKQIIKIFYSRKINKILLIILYTNDLRISI